MSDWINEIEPGARKAGRSPRHSNMAEVSTAISLKRIADVLDEFGLLAQALLRQTAADAGQDYETIKEQLRAGVLPKRKGP